VAGTAKEDLHLAALSMADIQSKATEVSGEKGKHMAQLDSNAIAVINC
jgi:hypothetical protein